MSPRAAATLVVTALLAACSGPHSTPPAAGVPAGEDGGATAAAPQPDADAGVTAAGADAGGAAAGADAGPGALPVTPPDGGLPPGTTGPVPDGGTAPPPGSSGAALGAVPAACPATFDALPPGEAVPPVAAPAEPLAATWEIRPAADHTLAFTGIVDDAGNVYWTEATSSSGPSELVSATRDGALRFRTPGPNGPLALAGGVLVSLAHVGSGCLQLDAPVAVAYSAATGAQVWRRELLPVLEPWMRTPGTCRYGGVAGLAAGPWGVLVAVSILDHDTTEHESGYVALDAATGEVRWTARTSSAGNTMMTGLPRVAEDGAGYGSRTVDYQRDDLLAFPGGAPPEVLGAASGPWHGAPVAAYGPLLVTSATGGSSWSGPPQGLEVRCRADGALRAQAGSVVGQPVLAGDAAWFFGDQLARWDVATGSLRWRIALGAPPAPGTGRTPRPLLFRSPPLVTSAGAVLFTEQPGTAGAVSSEQTLGTPVLRVIDLDGREVLRRELPLEVEAYDGRVALDRGRLFLGGQVLPSAGAAGVLRAFDLPGHDVARSGWIVPEGSLQRDQRAR